MEDAKRLYLIGIDSAPLWILRRIHKKYKMDGFGYFFTQNSIFDLESSLPPITPVAWPTIYTGRKPSEHGAHDFFTLTETYEKKLIYYNSETLPPFWERLSDAGIKSLIINPPTIVRPSGRRNVDMITGFPLPQTYSSKAMESAALSLDFSGEPEIEENLKNGSLSLPEAAHQYSESIRKRAELSFRLISGNDYGFAFICFTETDRMQHYSLGRPEWEDYIVPLYKHISDFIEWLVAYNRKKGGKWAVMVISDHGAQPTRSKFLVNSWLMQNGYIKLVEERSKSISTIVRTQNNGSYGSFSFGGVKGIDSEERLLCAASDGRSSHEHGVAMKESRAFASLSNNPVGSIWINDSRFSSPAVSSIKEKEALVREISEGLKNTKDIKGKKLIRRIHNTRKYYGKNPDFIVPDIMFEMAEGHTIDINSCSDEYISATGSSRSGDHTRYGIIGAYPKKSIPLSKKLTLTDISRLVSDFYSL